MKTPAARREQLLDEFEKSGASGQQFAELVGVKYQTFATWVQQRKRRRAAATKHKTSKVRWLEATVSPGDNHDSHGHLIVQLPAGARLEISRAKQIPMAAALLQALAKPAAAC